MKILFIASHYPPIKSGIGDYTHYLVTNLRQQHDMKIAVLTDSRAAVSQKADDKDFFPVVIDGRNNISTIVRVIKSWKPDMVHIQYPFDYKQWGLLQHFLPLLVRLTRIPVIATLHEPVSLGSWKNPFNAVIKLFNIALLRGVVFVRPNYFELMPPWFRNFMRIMPYRVILNASTIPVKHLTPEQRTNIAKRFSREGKRLVVYFGFAVPHKQVEQVFSIADPERDHIVLVCDLDTDIPYHQQILNLTNTETWKNHVTVTGFLPADTVGEIIASADAVVLPFGGIGGGVWNTSIHATKTQGTFLITTSSDTSGYSIEDNTYIAAPNDIIAMKQALQDYAGTHKNIKDIDDPWKIIAKLHAEFYHRLIFSGASHGS